MSSKQLLVIIGAGGHGSELCSYLRDLREQKVRLVGFIDEKRTKGPFCGAETMGNFEDLARLTRRYSKRAFFYITAVGGNPARRRLVEKIESMRLKNLRPWTLWHPQAAVGREVQVGEGTCLAPGVIVTTRVKLGKHCILNVNASVSHDCRIGDFVNINPGAVVCGNVTIGQGCYVGAGATVIDKVSIGEWSVIGAGAVVVEDIPPRVTAVGVPARVIKRHAR